MPKIRKVLADFEQRHGCDSQEAICALRWKLREIEMHQRNAERKKLWPMKFKLIEKGCNQ